MYYIYIFIYNKRSDLFHNLILSDVGQGMFLINKNKNRTLFHSKKRTLSILTSLYNNYDKSHGIKKLYNGLLSQ